MTEDIKILEAVERYILGQMSPDERVYFEQLRKTNPEIDQAVVEHTFFLQQMNRFEEVKNLKSTLNETHIHLAEKGLIKSPKLKGRAKVAYMMNRYKRTAMVAASIAGITALTMSALIWSLSPGKPANKQDIENLSRDIKDIRKDVRNIQNDNQQRDKVIENVKEQATTIPPIQYTSGGTGFMIDPKGYIVTNGHVIEKARNIAVQDNNGNELKAVVVYADPSRDIAILKINDTRFKSPSSIPYSIRKTNADLAEPIFTLGYPKNDIVYGDGYIASKSGYNSDTLACQIAIAANRGNSGSPIINKNGEVIGIITNKQNSAEGAVFAIHSKYIYSALNELLKKDSSFRIKLPSGSLLKEKDRVQQVRKISDFVYMVKVN